MIIEPNKNLSQKTLLNCYDNWTVWQRITYQPPNPDEVKNPGGLPFIDVGKFILCCRRYSNWGTPSCMTCRKETTCWANHIKGDRRYANLVGGFVKFINGRFASKNAMFIIKPEDIIPDHKDGTREVVQ